MKYQQLSQEERYLIIALLKTHLSMAEVARQIGRSTSKISRELSRNRRPTGYYAASVAHDYAIPHRHKSRRGSQFSEEQWQIILFLLRLDFSPEQISNTLKRFALFSISQFVSNSHCINNRIFSWEVPSQALTLAVH